MKQSTHNKDTKGGTYVADIVQDMVFHTCRVLRRNFCSLSVRNALGGAVCVGASIPNYFDNSKGTTAQSVSRVSVTVLNELKQDLLFSKPI
jgi:hypothetical protein